MGLGTQASESVVDKYLCQRGAGGHGDQDRGRVTPAAVFYGQVQDYGLYVTSTGRDAGQPGVEERMQSAQKTWWRDVKIY